MKKLTKLLALVLALVLLTGCAELTSALNGTDMVHYRDMEYTRPNMQRMENALNEACQLAKLENTHGNLQKLLEAIYAFYDEYDSFYTNYSLADIHTCQDLTDIYWEEEYTWCLERTSEAEAMLEELYMALAKSPCRNSLESDVYFGADYFDAYEGESTYDEGFLALLDRESQLVSQYYDLSAAALEYEYASEDYYDSCADGMAQLLIDLIRVRQEMAAYWGYEDYTLFANDFYYYRDYTPEESEQYLEEIAEHLVPLYRELEMDALEEYSSEEQTFAFVRKAAKNMGGTVAEAFRLMESAGLYDIAYGENKYNASFEVYLTSYYEPFVFMSPELTRYDCLTLAHEFGHFCNDYACYGSYAGVDVLEIFSQGMEYLALCYGEDTSDLTTYKMADSLCLFVEQAAFARFEQEMYRLPEDQLTPEGLYALYETTVLDYGFETVFYDPREFVTITHFYTNPMYILSYIFSNDAAMQLYQLEQETAGAGLTLFQENLASQQPWFLAFLEEAGLQSPFSPGRVEEIARTFQTVLN